MTYTNETLSVMIYLANTWSPTEAKKIYGENLGEHIWDKCCEYAKTYGYYGAMSMLIFGLDTENLNKLVARACELYDGRSNR